MNRLQRGINGLVQRFRKNVADSYYNLSQQQFERTERAPRKSDMSLQLDLYRGGIGNLDPVLNRQETKASNDYRYPFGLYEEAIDKDCHLAAVLDQRKSTLLARDRIIVPGDDSDNAEFAAEFVSECIKRITYGPGDGGFQRDLGDLLDAIPLGISISEVLWDTVSFAVSTKRSQRKRERPWIVPVALMSRHPRRFLFDANGAPMLVSRDRPMGEYLPERKFIIFRPYAKYEDPFGYSKLRPVWWLTWFKRMVVQYWIKYCERFGAPTAAATPSTPLSSEEKSDILAALNNIMQETGLVLPAGVDLKFYEMAAAGTILTYNEFISFCDNQISSAIIGQTLTSTAPKGGNLSLGEVHERVALGIQAQDARALEDIINGTLIPWIIEFNLPGYPMPRMEIVTAPPRDLRQELDMLLGPAKGLIDTNYGISKRYVEETFTVKPAKDGDDEDTLALEAAPIGLDPNVDPSQTPAVKSPARQAQRERKRNDQSRNPGTPAKGS